MTMQVLCRIDDIPEGGARGFDPHRQGTLSMFVLRRADDRLVAWRDWCPHWRAGPMAWRTHAYLSADGRHVVCAAHGARFDPDTGLCVQGPCLGDSLLPVALEVRGDTVLADIDHSRETPA